jgi:hypothetical protein
VELKEQTKYLTEDCNSNDDLMVYNYKYRVFLGDINPDIDSLRNDTTWEMIKVRKGICFSVDQKSARYTKIKLSMSIKVTVYNSFVKLFSISFGCNSYEDCISINVYNSIISIGTYYIGNELHKAKIEIKNTTISEIIATLKFLENQRIFVPKKNKEEWEKFNWISMFEALVYILSKFEEKSNNTNYIFETLELKKFK